MRKIVWLLEETLIAIHHRQIAEHGGGEGLRDEGLLSSALARPQNLLAYGDAPPDLASLAAAYAYGIARNHPFVDGNKRTALVAARTFLILNGVDLDATQDDKVLTFLSLAEGAISEQELADWIRQRIQS
ncbi:MAG TPA: type II toxin-antitoxin system death-on-curing family toxin [Pyrinomonadaceae bacterium]|jgi:death-on-curing protein|nr:type II toxin-antitoxin system death-on-curing family toxin [Pyrinomonadaceae bacterium]